jgi:tRNA A37 threonylcarbamoyladenosine synthetase subunit TsaC/SUA5/YrdC
MPVVPATAAGLRYADSELAIGRPVVVPFAPPRAYGVVGRDGAAVNLAKGRPADQPVGSAVADFTTVTPFLLLDEDTRDLARWLAAEHFLNLLLPVRDDAPAWLRPSTSKGWLGLMLGFPARIRGLLDRHGHLYASSANRTGGPVAVTADAANAAFDDRLLVIDGDPDRDPAIPSGSATMLRVGPDRALELVRPGINDAAFAGTAEQFLAELLHRWERARPTGTPS